MKNKKKLYIFVAANLIWGCFCSCRKGMVFIGELRVEEPLLVGMMK